MVGFAPFNNGGGGGDRTRVREQFRRDHYVRSQPDDISPTTAPADESRGRPVPEFRRAPWNGGAQLACFDVVGTGVAGNTSPNGLPNCLGGQRVRVIVGV